MHIRFLLIASVLLLAACKAGSDAPAPATASGSPSSTHPSAISGEEVFSACAACHGLAPDAPQRLGPNLHGLFGRTAGTNAGFAYSPALKASGIVWDPDTLDTYLAAPGRAVPGTRMVMAVPDPQRRKALIEYLSSR